MNQTSRKRLADVLPPEFLQGEFESCPAMRHAFMDVIAVHEGDLPWPSHHKYVSRWYVLLNGKAVGFNENPSRGWSFPVIKYQEPIADTTLSVTLRFHSILHLKLHQVLVSYQFRFTIHGDKVGFEYHHADKGIGVLLTPVDDDLEYGCLKPDGREVYSHDDYNKLEWEWLSEPHLPVEEALRRELHILVMVRPALMY